MRELQLLLLIMILLFFRRLRHGESGKMCTALEAWLVFHTSAFPPFRQIKWLPMFWHSSRFDGIGLPTAGTMSHRAEPGWHSSRCHVMPRSASNFPTKRMAADTCEVQRLRYTEPGSPTPATTLSSFSRSFAPARRSRGEGGCFAGRPALLPSHWQDANATLACGSSWAAALASSSG
jgi:hypothetical protein